MPSSGRYWASHIFSLTYTEKLNIEIASALLLHPLSFEKKSQTWRFVNPNNFPDDIEHHRRLQEKHQVSLSTQECC